MTHITDDQGFWYANCISCTGFVVAAEKERQSEPTKRENRIKISLVDSVNSDLQAWKQQCQRHWPRRSVSSPEEKKFRERVMEWCSYRRFAALRPGNCRLRSLSACASVLISKLFFPFDMKVW